MRIRRYGVPICLLRLLSTSPLRQALVLCGIVSCLLCLPLVKAYAQLPRPTSYLFVELKDPDGKSVTEATITVSDAQEKEINVGVSRYGKQFDVRFPIRPDHHYNVLISSAGYLPSEHVFFAENQMGRLIEEFPITHRSQTTLIVLRKPPATLTEHKALELEEQNHQLILAAKRGDAASVRRLLLTGIKPDTTDANGTPAIVWAAFAGDAETIMALMNAGALVRNKDTLAYQALLVFFDQGLSRQVRARTVAGDKQPRLENEVLDQNDAAVRKLIKAGAAVDLKDAERTVLNTAIDRVLDSLSPKAIKALLAAGASVNSADHRGTTPLMVAAESGSPETVRMLINAGASVNAKDSDGDTPLIAAQISRSYPGRYHPDIVKALIAAGADVNVANKSGDTALIKAAEADLSDSIEMLLAAGANVNAKDHVGYSALTAAFDFHYYSKGSNYYPTAATLKALLAAGANIRDVNRAGDTPLRRAAEINSVDAVKMLLAAGADINFRNQKGQTMLMYDRVGSGLPSVEIFKTLIAAHADVNAVDGIKRTPLMFAAGGASPAIVTLLLDSGAKPSVNARDKSDWTALMYACSAPVYYSSPEDHLQIVKALIAAGADVNVKDSLGATPLTLAQRERNEAVVRFLEALSKP